MTERNIREQVAAAMDIEREVAQIEQRAEKQGEEYEKVALKLEAHIEKICG
jgi:hypothetical protein